MPDDCEPEKLGSVVYNFASAKMYMRLAKQYIERIAEITGSNRETEISIKCIEEAELWLVKHLKEAGDNV